MESSENDTTYDTSWSPATNWTIAHGSLLNSVTFESSLSLIEHENNENQDQSSGVDSTAKSPVLLHPLSPDSTPCEVTITFAQKHELQQVYVRSTARVYEIYCTSELRGSSEYLCTVRCGVATRGEKVLCITDIEEAVLAHDKGSTKEQADEKLTNGSNLSINEDGWVEVKVHGTPYLVSRNSSLTSDNEINLGRNSQDLYEATAEITDANPCMSLTIRLLSLQNKGCVCIDEVYVFADPIDAANLDNQSGPVENSTGSSLVAMLVPTLLQFSKTKGVGRAQDKRDVDTREKPKSKEIGLKTTENGLKTTDLIGVGSKIMQEATSSSADLQGVQFQEAYGPPAEPVQLKKVPPQNSDAEDKPDSPCIHIKGFLDQVVSRINRIEDLILRLEESMLKPISSIDERLQRVEYQVEMLTKKTQNSGSLSFTRISAPEFSCSESETNSSYNSTDSSYVVSDANKDLHSAVPSMPPEAIPVSVNDKELHPGLVVTAPDFPNCDDEEEKQEVESETNSFYNSTDSSYVVSEANKDLRSAVPSMPPEATPVSVNDKELHPCLVVTAPDFPNCDDEEEKQEVESLKESPKDKPKHAMSIDDALASALAGFLSSTSMPSQRYSPILAVKAPEFPNDENNSEETPSPKAPSEIFTDPSTSLSEPDEIKCARDSFASLSIYSLENDVNAVRSPNSDSEKTGDGVDEQRQHGEGEDDNSQETYFDNARNMERIDSYQMTGGTKNLEIGDRTSNVSGLEKTDAVERISGNRSDDVSDASQEGVRELIESNEVTEGGSSQDILQNVVEFSVTASQVDFETPILDVKFISRENSSIKSPLEALLVGMSDLSEVPSTKESGNDGPEMGDECNLISVELGVVESASDNLISVHLDSYNARDMPSIAEFDDRQDCFKSNSQEMSVGSLI